MMVLLFALAGLSAAFAVIWILLAVRRARTDSAPPRLLLAGMGGAALATLGVYLLVGQPEMPGQPREGRILELQAKAATDPGAMTREEMLTLLEEQTQRSPDDPRPHVFIGTLLADGGRDADAARAFQAALRRDPDNVDAMVGLGRALVALEDQTVGAQARALFEAAASARPQDPVPVFYLALAAAQGPEPASAAPLWQRLLTLLPAEDPRRAMATTMLEAARRGERLEMPG